MKVYAIEEQRGLGLSECPSVNYPTEFLFFNKNVAENRAKELWLKNTTEEERKSGWCALNYIVVEKTVI